MNKAGNDAWWEQVREIHSEMPTGTHYKDAEIEVFYRLYRNMTKNGLSQSEIHNHFKEYFNIGRSAFYSRLRKVECHYVIP